MAEIPQKLDFLTWIIQIFVRKVQQFVRKYYIIWSIDLANKLYNIEKFLISYYVILGLESRKKYCFMKKKLIILILTYNQSLQNFVLSLFNFTPWILHRKTDR